MKLITRNTDYAIRALLVMAKKRDTLFSVSQLTQVLAIPRPFLRKILQILNKKGIVKSYKGQGGGFLLALAPRKIFLVDLIGIFQGQFKLYGCLFKKSICPDVRNCLLKQKLDEIEKYVGLQLKSITIASLLPQ